jgi:hypothetical protein
MEGGDTELQSRKPAKIRTKLLPRFVIRAFADTPRPVAFLLGTLYSVLLPSVSMVIVLCTRSTLTIRAPLEKAAQVNLTLVVGAVANHRPRVYDG